MTLFVIPIDPLVTLSPAPGCTIPFADAVASGKSAGTSALNVGAASDPDAGPTNTAFAACVSSVNVMFAVKSSGLFTAIDKGVDSVTVTD